MARNENLPFERGNTWYNGNTIDSANLGGVNLEGKEFVVEDGLPGQTGGVSNDRTGRYVTLRVVRNVGAAALLPKYAVRWQKTAANYAFHGRVDGMGAVTGENIAGIVDEYLPAAGVPVNDLFYIVVRGPSLVRTDLAGGANNVINVGDVLMALTAVTSGATTAGRVLTQDLTGATAVLGNNIQNRVGRAMSAATTANTNADLLADIWIVS